MATDGNLSAVPAPAEPEEGQGDGRGEAGPEHTVPLRNGRTLTVASSPDRKADSDQIVELRAASGELELRIRMTEEGPLLCVDGLRLSMTAADDIELRCSAFTVDAESVAITSQGGIDLSAEKEVGVCSKDDVRVRGKMIFLN